MIPTTAPPNNDYDQADLDAEEVTSGRSTVWPLAISALIAFVIPLAIAFCLVGPQ